MTSANLAALVAENRDSIEELAEVLLGPRLSDLQGGGRDERQGLVAEFHHIKQGQAEIKAKLDNGIKRRLTQVLIAVITTAGTVIVAVIANAA